MPSVNSSAIAAISWTPSVKNTARNFVTGQANLFEALTKGTLEIQFNERGTYEYYDVPSTVWLALSNASSKGSYFNRNIRNRFSYSRIG